MANRVAAALLLLVALGCRAPVPHAVTLYPPPPPPRLPDLPPITPVPSNLDLGTIPATVTHADDPAPAFRELTDAVCRDRAVWASAIANRLEAEDRLPVSSEAGDQACARLRHSVRRFLVLEARNQDAATALERHFQLADAEARTGLVRDALPTITKLRETATAAKSAGVRYPIDAAELTRMLSQTESQLAQAESGIRLLNVELRRRIGLPPGPASERLWPTGDFRIDPNPVDPNAAANAAVADRPELRAWRALEAGLTPETLPVAREMLRGANLLTGVPPAADQSTAAVNRRSKLDPVIVSELAARQRQVREWIETRERQIGDEARAAAEALNAQTRRVMLARDRAETWRVRRDDAVRQHQAGLPEGDLLAAQAELDWLKARAEVTAEVTAWHQARSRLRAAQGWLVWETMPASAGRVE